jgi:hypothetical protein
MGASWHLDSRLGLLLAPATLPLAVLRLLCCMAGSSARPQGHPACRCMSPALSHCALFRYAKYDWVTQSCQHVMEVSVIPPGEGYQWAAAYSNQVLLVVSLVLFRTIIGAVEWVLDITGRLKGPRLSEKGKMMVEMSKSIAQSYNIGSKAASTGVRFEDVQVCMACLYAAAGASDRERSTMCHPHALPVLRAYAVVCRALTMSKETSRRF